MFFFLNKIYFEHNCFKNMKIQQNINYDPINKSKFYLIKTLIPSYSTIKIKNVILRSSGNFIYILSRDIHEGCKYILKFNQRHIRTKHSKLSLNEIQ